MTSRAWQEHVVRVVKVQGRIVIIFLQAASGWTATLYATYPHILISYFDTFHTVVHSCTSFVHGVFNSDIRLRSGCVVLPDTAFIMQVVALPVFLTLYFLSDRVCKFIVNMKRVQSRTMENSYWHGMGERMTLPYFWFTYLAYTPLTLAIVSHMPIKGGAFDCFLEEYSGGECYRRCLRRVTASPYRFTHADANRKASGFGLAKVLDGSFPLPLRCRKATQNISIEDMHFAAKRRVGAGPI